MLKGLGQLGDMAKMNKTAQEMQARMGGLQEELAKLTVTGESGGGLVQAASTAKGELTGISIDPSLFRAEDKEVVEDLILAAIKDAQARATERSIEEMRKLTAELGLPADFKLPL